MLLRDIDIETRLSPLLIDQYRLVIDPFDPDCLQGASYDLHLSKDLLLMRSGDVWSVDPDAPGEYTTPATIQDIFYLQSGEFVLGSTIECVEIPEDIVARIEGKSSRGRIGLTIHTTAGFVDAGFKGTLTLEIRNDAPFSIILRAGMRIAQLAFDQLPGRVRRPYGSAGVQSRYQNQTGPTPARPQPGPFSLPTGADRIPGHGIT